MHRKNQVVIVTLLALVLIIVQSRAQNVTANRKADKEDIYALVIRSQMEEWIRGVISARLRQKMQVTRQSRNS